MNEALRRCEGTLPVSILMRTRLLPLILAALLLFPLIAMAGQPAQVLVEAEGFKDYGGWSLDTQFTHIMGSSYLLAHGLGEPVNDATTTAKFPEAGKYKVLVRTKDWVAHWNAPGQPGRFQLIVNGKPLATTFGTEGAEWHWQDGGTVDLPAGEVSLALHDLTGFDGRCDAILFTTDLSFTPPVDSKALEAWRKKSEGLPEKPVEAGPFDLVVVGGGYAGIASALSAARMGCKVALIQDRPVLGGNGSSEIRVWSQGETTLGKYPKLGQIVEEFADNAKSSPGTAEEFGDAKKEAIVRAEKNISLYLNHQAFAVEAKNNRILSVTARDTRTNLETRFTAPLFVDSTGHGTIGALAGADFDMLEKGHMGMSNMWRWEDTGKPRTFPQTPWALPLTMKDFPYPRRGEAEWFWEGGFFQDPINDLEYIRDWNLRAAYGAFNAMKNGDGKDKHVNAKLVWLAYIGGNRESRRLMGDLVLTRDDIFAKKEFNDGCVPTTWDIDLHEPKEQYAKKFPQDPFISKAIFDSRVDKRYGYPVPYRCFYSRNIQNLFMAGRDISVDHGALGTVRVMRTCGMEGEVVGKAASICTEYNCTPRAVYDYHLDELKDLMNLPGRARRENVKETPKADAPLPYDPNVVGKPAPPKRVGGSKPAIVYKGIDPKTVPGIVITDSQATLTGNWTPGTGVNGFLGDAYHYANGPEARTARYEFRVPASGKYEVRFNYSPHANRASNVPVTVFSADGQKTLTVDEQKAPTLEHGFRSLGVFQFNAATPGAVVVSNKGTNGIVAVDAIQVLPAK
jgi:hypothetical protein